MSTTNANFNNRSVCPNCGSHDTEGVHTEKLNDHHEETRICDGCKGQYTCFLFYEHVEMDYVEGDDTDEEDTDD